MILKKYFFIIAASVLFFLTIKISSTYTSPSIQLIINTPSLNNPKMIKNIDRELAKIKGISFYQISLQSNALLINYDESKINDKDILGALNKWGCETQTVSYNPIF